MVPKQQIIAAIVEIAGVIFSEILLISNRVSGLIL
jgi:hypothetical protein